MSKKEKKDQEKIEPSQNIDPFKWGYKQDSSVSIPAPLFMALIDFTGYVAETEQKEYVEKLSFVVGTEPKEQEEVVKVFTTRKGKQAEQIFNEALNVHYDNIDKGFAISLEEVKLNLGDEPKPEPKG